MPDQLNDIDIPPEPSDFVILHDDIHHVVDLISAQQAQIDELKAQNAKLIESHNQVGENVAWLVANTQGIFQMFNSPEMMNQMMGMVLGGGNAGRLNPNPDPGPAK